MTFRTTLKQMLRTPLRTVLFLLLILLAAALLTTGANLYGSAVQARREVSETYATVGTVLQMPDSSRNQLIFNGYDDVFVDIPEYTTTIPEDLFDGLPTKLPVENRPSILTSGTRPDGTALTTLRQASMTMAIVFTPDEDVDGADEEYQTSHRSGSGLFGFTATPVSINGQPSVDWFRYYAITDTDKLYFIWPSGTDGPLVPLKAGQEYIAFASLGYGSYDRGVPMFLTNAVKSCEPGKTAMNAEYTESLVFDSGDPEAREVLSRTVESLKLLFPGPYLPLGTVPIPGTVITVPTNGLTLLEPFYRDQVTVKYGREITEEEFESGAKVCMIPEVFATDPPEGNYSNYLKVGDKISLTWLGAVYGLGPALLSPNAGVLDNTGFGGSPTETDGGEYEIVGVYTSDAIGNYDDANLGANEIIVPAASFDFDSVPILQGGLLQSGCCSFQLENGTSSAFLKAFEELGYDNLQLKINDMGYSTIAKGLDAVELLSLILLFAGGLSALSLLVFFVHLQITRQKREAAIQVSLGAGKKRCFASLLLSVMLVAVVGTAAGTLAGHVITGNLAQGIYTQAKATGYSRDFSDQFEASLEQDYTYRGEASPLYSLLCGLSLAGGALLLSCAAARQALKPEPLALLSQKEKE